MEMLRDVRHVEEVLKEHLLHVWVIIDVKNPNVIIAPPKATNVINATRISL
jgi:hypothetical protein